MFTPVEMDYLITLIANNSKFDNIWSVNLEKKENKIIGTFDDRHSNTYSVIIKNDKVNIKAL